MTTQPMDPDNPPAWAVEGVRLNAYDPRWPDCAARYADELEPAAGLAEPDPCQPARPLAI